jgi:hypothetical protein
MATMKANMSRSGQRNAGHAVEAVNVKQVLVYLTHAQHADLLKRKTRRGIPGSEQIRGAIDHYLKEMERGK